MRLAAAVVLLWASPAALPAQAPVSNRATHLALGSDVTDARAVWLNPGGLGLVPLASVMADITATDPFEGSRLSQWSFGFNSRGLALGYQHDRFGRGAGVRDTYRFAFGRGDSRTALGAALTLYRGNGHGSGVDVGLLHRPRPALRLSAVVAHIGEPELDGGELPVTLEPSFTWRTASTPLALAAGAALTSDSLRQWTVALSFEGPARVPVTALLRLDSPRDFAEARLTLGVGWGRQDMVQLALTARKDLDDVLLGSLSGVSTRTFGR